MKIKVVNIRVLILILLFTLLSAPSVYSQTGSLKVGAARVEVTPQPGPESYPPSGKYEHERLFVRAILLDNGVTRAALLGIDGNFGVDTYNNTVQWLAKELGCPEENIIMSSTHSHSARLPEPADKAVIDAVRQAKANLQPAKVGFGTGMAYLNVNRDAIDKKTRLWTQASNPEGPSDKTIAVVMFTDMQGAPIAGYMNYAMHPINGYLTGITSADFPGAACRHIEQAFRDNMVMIFSQGASGDQNPLWIRPATNVLASKSGIEITGYDIIREEVEGPMRDGKTPNGKPDAQVAEIFERWIDALGMILGEEVIRVMTSISQLDGDVRIQGSKTIITLPGRTRTNTGREGAPGTYEDGPPVDIRLGLLGIGNIALTSINAEIYNIFAQHLKKASPMTNTVMVTIANGRTNSGYIVDDASYGKYSFQVLSNRLKPGYAEQAITNGFVGLIEDYIAR